MSEPRSIADVFHQRVRATPWSVAYEVRTGDTWRTWTWAEVGDAVRELSAGLIALGVAPGERVAILAGTRLEWILADLAILCAGAATTTIYPSSTADECRYILQDAGVVLAFVEDTAQRAKLADLADLPVHTVIQLDGTPDAPDTLSPDTLRERGRAWLDANGTDAWEAVGRAVTPEDLATLIYTSGTTGRPKGVRLVHDNWLAQGDAIAPLIEALREPEDKLIIWLPLAHAYGKVIELAGMAYAVPTVIDGELARLPQTLRERRPSWVPAVPRVFEKMRERMESGAREKGPRAHRVFLAAEQVAIAESRARRGGRVPIGLRVRHALFERLVYRRIRDAFGGRVRAFLSGSAPLSPELQHFLDGVGLPVLEGWGLTECAAVGTANRPEELRFGSVGKPGDQMEVRIADDGEVLLRGRAVMRGYHGLPEATAEAFRDGWFRTGDIGRIDEDGFLHITGRIKELLVTAGGKNVAPAPIELAVKARCPILQEVVMVGDRRPTCVALMTLEPDFAAGWARERGLPEDVASLSVHPEVRAVIQAAVDEVNATLASYTTIKAFDVLPRPLTEAEGDLTPSQKVRRTLVIERFADRVDALYAR